MSDLVGRVRRFNRHWTRVLGLLDQGLLATEHSLAEARVIFELAQRDRWERLALRDHLDLDASFLTRILTSLEEKGLVTTSRSDVDGRRRNVALTDAGRAAFAVIDARSAQQIRGLLRPLTAGQQRTIGEAMTVISSLVQADSDDRNVTVRGLATGDLGWVVQRHGEIYADEFGWNQDFECLIAKIVADYHTNHRPGRENAWVAEVDGARAGCVFCCQRDPDTAQLRILLVEPWARGLGIGTRLVDECVRFARDAGYSTIMLWTNDVLAAARRIYEAAGFTLVEAEPHHSFGHHLVGQNWELVLTEEPS
ncbi:MAG: helix-turn-helix domain-containing GNAT family N-acetyltransferase [Actinobacteria bacterium]|nr:helix-turn-helix domain-containing GNAT family N-acetyltransferase [Actinomycetota bacterium]